MNEIYSGIMAVEVRNMSGVVITRACDMEWGVRFGYRYVTIHVGVCLNRDLGMVWYGLCWTIFMDTEYRRARAGFLRSGLIDPTKEWLIFTIIKK